MKAAGRDDFGLFAPVEAARRDDFGLFAAPEVVAGQEGVGRDRLVHGGDLLGDVSGSSSVVDGVQDVVVHHREYLQILICFVV